MSKNIFDISDISDLPADIVGCIPNRAMTKTEKLANLFHISGRPLNTSELVVGYYRQYGEKISARSVSSILQGMSKSKSYEVTKVEKATYFVDRRNLKY